MFEVSDEFDAILKRGKMETEERALKKGEKRNSRKIAKRMLADGTLTIFQIAKFTELSIEEVESIKNCTRF